MAFSPLPKTLALYRVLMGHSASLLERLLKLRAEWGKEDALRLAERRGEASQPRQHGFLVWIHAASVGEANSVLALVEALLARGNVSILVTTTTLTSASLMAMRLPTERAIHQFVPVDHPRWVERFIDHWRPDLALIVESELWPNLLLTAEAKGVRLVLLNARMSERSFRRWRRASGAAARLLSCFALCLAQDEKTAARLSVLGAKQVECCGNLKLAAEPLPDIPAEHAALQAMIGTRPCFVAASTHEGEEPIIAEAALRLRPRFPDLLVILAPRHPERGDAIAKALRAVDIDVAQRSRDEPITPRTEIYLADTLGELGLFYRLAPLAFVGGSLVPHGGQNPLEPARLGRFVLHGPHVQNFAESFAALTAVGGAQEVGSAASLADSLERLLHAPEALHTRGTQAASVVQAADQVLARVLARLEPFLPPSGLRRRDGCA